MIPSIHHVNDHIIHFVGRSNEGGGEAEMSIILYKDVFHFGEVGRFHTIPECFNYQTVAIERCDPQDFFIAVLYTLNYNANPFKIVKIPTISQNESAPPILQSVSSSSFNLFRNCFLLDEQVLLVGVN